jgi:aminopeptidase N
MKARFQVNIARTQDYNSISNMPRENTSEPDPNIGERVWDSFKETPPMSTYIVAFVVSDLKNMSMYDEKNTMWLREDVLPEGDYALSIAQAIIMLLENYTEIMYELPKLDQVAIPNLDFLAMENWGIVTEMESSVLHKEGESAAAKKQVILLLVAHEFAHFWFGNLVTPKWWSYLWLSEGIATYYEYRISEKIETDWNIEEQFIVDIFQPALAGDSLNSSHPLTYDVHTPEEIESLFDTISYNKGASLLRSVEHFLTKETLHKGLSKYLKEFSHSSADANDLFRVLDKQQKKDKILPADMDVKTILDSWTLQSGYPVIHVQRVDRGIHVVQERFLLERQNDTVGATWWVPISYTKSTNSDFTDTKPKAWLRNQPELMLEENITDTEWIIFNIQATGFYRVNYDPLTWSLITNHLTSPFYRDIHVLNRAQLLDDAFSLSRAGLLNYTRSLELSTYLAEEIHLIPWLTYNDIISFINRQLRGTDIYDSFKAYVLTLLNKLYNSLAFQYNTEDSHVMKMIQPTVIEWACTLGSKDCVAKALEMFSKWTENPENYIIPPDIKKAVYCTAARNDNNTWLLLWDQYQHHHSNSDAKWDMYKALGCTEDEDLLKR